MNPVPAPADVSAVLLVLAGAAVAVNRFVELLKPLLHADSIPEQYRPFLVYIASIAVSILTVFSIGEPANLLSINARLSGVPLAAGLTITGFVLAFGSNMIHAVAGVLTGREVPPTTETPTATVDVSISQ